VAVDVPVPLHAIASTTSGFNGAHLALSTDGLEIWVWGKKTGLMGPDSEERLDNCILDPADARNVFIKPDDFRACEPLRVTGSGLGGRPVRDLVSSGGQAVALSADGRVWNWGRTFEVTPDVSYDHIDISDPKEMDLSPLQGARVVGLAAAEEGGQFVNFLYDENGSLWAMGEHFHLLGTGSREKFNPGFAKVAFPPEAGRIVELSLASDYALAVDENHCFWAWGQNSNHDGQGNPLFEVTTPRSTVFMPVPVLPGLSSPGCPVAIRPAITSAPELNIIQGGSYVYQVEIDNPNGFPVEFQLEQAPSGMVVDADSGLLEWPVPEVGAHTVELKVMDGRGLFGTQQFILRVAAETFEIDSVPPASVTQNSLFKYQPSISGSTTGLEYQLIDGPADMRIVFGTRFEWVADEVGDHFVSILATNALGQTATQQFTLNVSQLPGTEQLTGEVLGLFADRTVLLQDFETGQHFELNANGSFSIGAFSVGESYRLNVYHSYQFCWVQEGDQGVVQEGVHESIVIECEQSSPSGTGPSEPFKAGPRRDDSA